MTTKTAFRTAFIGRSLFKGALGHLTVGLAALGLFAALLYPLTGVPAKGFLWAAGTYALLAALVMYQLPAHRPHSAFGLANRITLARGVIASLLAGFIGQAEVLAAHGWLLVGLALLGLVLDGFDGFAARRSGQSSPFGARFDMETDSLMILILAGLAWSTGKVGAWILLIGGMRYGFAAAGFFLPWLRGTLPASKRRQAVCVIQIVALFLLLVPFLPPWGASLIGAVALASLTYSFAVDVAWLWRGAGFSQTMIGGNR